ncbi:MAG TPA: hypothetical protein VNU19_22650 [Candidatus Acidoferrum sp.]|jgi:hypothetical protein|nr:hypothetical protein [Candidatus Acidoferrum sp.]
MPNSNQANDIARYAAAVRAALASLPDAERESLLEDLESHLAEVAGESDQSLEERLGKPATYAAELTSAYGAASETGNVPRGARYRDRLWALVSAALGTHAYSEVRAFLPELRAGWWVLRAYLLVLILAFMFRGGLNLRPIPDPFTSGGLLQILATLVAIVLSVRLGRRGMPANRGWRAAAIGVNVGVALLALPVLVSMGTGSTYYGYYADSSDPNLSQASASYYAGFTNIYPYSKDGQPLKDVLLYDQDGLPIVPAANGLTTDVPVGADGLPIQNAYPLTQRDQNGVPVVPPRVALPPWQPSPSPSSTPTPPITTP